MKYDEARSKIKSGDLLAWTHSQWGSWYDVKIQMVRAFTQSEYSHVGIAYTLADRVFVIESVTGGIRMQPLSKWTPFYWLPIEQYWDDDVEKQAMSKMGEEYSTFDAIRSFFTTITPGTDKAWECAEYANFIIGQRHKNIANIRNVPSETVKWAQDVLNAPLYLVTQDGDTK